MNHQDIKNLSLALHRWREYWLIRKTAIRLFPDKEDRGAYTESEVRAILKELKVI